MSPAITAECELLAQLSADWSELSTIKYIKTFTYLFYNIQVQLIDENRIWIKGTYMYYDNTWFIYEESDSAEIRTRVSVDTDQRRYPLRYTVRRFAYY